MDDENAPKGKTSILMFFAVLGPGLITANVDNDAGGIYTYSLAGARYGYSLLWTLIPITLLLIIVQEMSARLGAVTGKGLADLIREEFGFRITFFLMVVLTAANLGNIMAEFAGVASSMEVFGISKYISVPVVALFVWLLVVKGTYKTVEKVFLVACSIYICYIFSGIWAKPDWGAAALATVRPTLQLNFGYVAMLIGIIGTTIAPWMQFYLQSAIVEKGVDQKQYSASRLEVVIGCIFTDVVAFFIIVACAATLYTAGRGDIRDAGEAATALRPLVGEYASALFALGLLNASVFAASILPLATAYSVCEGLGVEAGVNKKFREAPVFYWLYTLLIVIGAAIILVPGVPLISLIYLSQIANGILLPFVLVFMLVLINRRDLMGEFTNSKAFNFVTGASVAIIILLTIALLFMGL